MFKLIKGAKGKDRMTLASSTCPHWPCTRSFQVSAQKCACLEPAFPRVIGGICGPVSGEYSPPAQTLVFWKQAKRSPGLKSQGKVAVINACVIPGALSPFL